MAFASPMGLSKSRCNGAHQIGAYQLECLHHEFLLSKRPRNARPQLSAVMTEPLKGYRIGVTADRRSSEQIAMLTERGAKCVHGAMLATSAPRTTAVLHDRTRQLLACPPQLLIVTTGHGLRTWIDSADSTGYGGELRQILNRCPVLVRGPKAHGAAIAAGLHVAWHGAEATTTELLHHVHTLNVRGQRIAVQASDASRCELFDALEDLGADVVAVPTNHRSLPVDTGAADALIRAVADRKVDAITFTARTATENFLEFAHELGLAEQVDEAFREGVKTFCVGPSAARALAARGLPQPEQPAENRLGALVRCVVAAFGAQNTEVQIGGRPVQLQGRMVVVDGGEPAMLAARERELLEILLERPGVVLSKAAILHKVWGSVESDTHVVEVTVGRLRQRLGAAGIGIETVVRRGYRASPI